MDAVEVPPVVRRPLGPECAAGLVEMLDVSHRELLIEVTSLVGDRIDRRLTDEFSKFRVELAADLSAFRQNMVDSLSSLRIEMTSADAALRQEMTVADAALRSDMTAGFSLVRSEIAQARFDTLKWAFVFWLSQVAVVAGILSALLRHP